MTLTPSSPLRPKIETINTSIEKREKGRERKALKAAQLDRAIENELIQVRTLLLLLLCAVWGCVCCVWVCSVERWR